MWYFTWILGVGFAAAFAVINAMWLESGLRYRHPRHRPILRHHVTVYSPLGARASRPLKMAAKMAAFPGKGRGE